MRTTLTGGFAAVIARDAFTDRDAPVECVAAADCPVPFNVNLMHAVLPSVERMQAMMKWLLDY